MIGLYTSYYQDERQGEIDFALMQNVRCKEIDFIVLFIENYELPKEIKEKAGSKIIEIHGDRPTYGDFFTEMGHYDGVRVLANSDIYFDETATLFNRITKGTCYALTRHELKGQKVEPFRASNTAQPMWSQDVWAFAEDDEPHNISLSFSYKYFEVLAIDERTKQIEPINFYLGVPGCDNHIAYLLKSQYNLINPYPQIRAIHVHANDERDYKVKKRITGNHAKWGQLHKVVPSTI